MAEIVSGLFGLDPMQVRQQEQQKRQLFANQLAQTYVDPYEQANALRGGLVGNAIGSFLGGVFGLESPELKRATTLEGILQQTQQEVGSQDPAVLYPELARRLSAAGFTREALQVGAVGDKAKRDALKETSDVMYKESMSKYYKVLEANQEAVLESKKIEQQGQVAYGALQAYKGIADPVGKTRVWNTTMDALAKKGVDVEAIKDIPWEQREATLNSIVESSETSATRVKEVVAQMNNNIKISQEEGRNQRNADNIAMKKELDGLNRQIDYLRIGSAERIALEKRTTSLEDKIKLNDIQNKDDVNANAAASTKLKEWNNQIYSYLENDLGLDSKSADSAISFFNNTYQDLLGEKREDGYPKYTPATALNQAKITLESSLKDQDKTIAGVKVGTKKTFSGKAVTPKAAVPTKKYNPKTGQLEVVK